MDVKYINPFLNALQNIMPQLGMSKIEKKRLEVKGREITSPGVLIILGMIGDVKGNVIYGTSMDNAKKIASTMMMGMPVDNFDELAQSAVSELTNMLTANAAISLSEEGLHVDISTPTLVYGDFTATASTPQVICIEVLVDGMPFEVNVSLQKA